MTESKFYRISGDSTQHRGVVPDIDFPSLFNAGEIGESALDNALDWDQISPVRHREYGMFSSLLPTLEQRHRNRAQSDPDFVYLTDQVAMAAETQGLKALPLNEVERVALRDSQENRALAIENKRREALGIDTLESLRDEDEMVSLDESDEDSMEPTELSNAQDGELPVAETEEAEDEDPDVLLLEAGRILADALALGGRATSPTVTAQR